MTGRMLVEKIAAEHPEMFKRVRLACGDSDGRLFDLDEHAALIVVKVLEARKRAAT